LLTFVAIAVSISISAMTLLMPATTLIAIMTSAIAPGIVTVAPLMLVPGLGLGLAWGGRGRRVAAAEQPAK
jgi:hypothetical protein